MNRGAKAGVIGTCVVMLTAGGYGAYHIVSAVAGTSSAAPRPAATALSTTPPSNDNALKRAQSFLDSWHAGPDHYAGAASDTNDPTAAQTALAGYGTGLKLTSVAFSNVAAAGLSSTVTGASHVTFTVTAQIAGGTWTYPGALDVVQSVGGNTSVRWAPSVLYPKLTPGQTLATGPIPVSASDVTVTDNKGVELTAAQDPSLGDILNQLKTKFAAKATGTSGSGVAVVDSTGTAVATAQVFTPPTGAKIKTTLDAKLQAQAELGVKDAHLAGKAAGVVAIDHSNGWIKAIAYSGSQGDIAINGWSAPGSTMKIITAATLIDKGGLNPGSPAPCTPNILVAGQTFQNVDNEQAKASTMQDAFKMSCNTAFIKLMDNAWNSNPAEGFTAQSEEAANVFGLGNWSIGVATMNPQVKPSNGSRNLRAADAIGQGNIAVSPLVMASVGATVANSGFMQPILVPGLAQTPASSPISSSTAADLRRMMVATAQGGTAAPRVGGMSGVGAKTGTAEIGNGQPNNGWFVAYDGKLSVAAEVIGGLRGVDSAGYVVADILRND
ncbi:hypothetical protein ABIA33_001022 [Streptacidiphilus sp. MAP12-16]|uniref:penicillin-binding transpeptidase domain-containing protein n=1 Tax=Streptacidiphilus sp. MAP12-16 TaxID=3156300 RepID=UPI003515A34A